MNYRETQNTFLNALVTKNFRATMDFLCYANIAEMENNYIKNWSLLEIKHVVLSRSSYVEAFDIIFLAMHTHGLQGALFPSFHSDSDTRNGFLYTTQHIKIITRVMLWSKSFGLRYANKQMQ